jgi:sugar phosphate isomerase/epimerase
LKDQIKLACCNFIPQIDQLNEFAKHHQFDGIEWSWNRATLPNTPSEEEALLKQISVLDPLEIRYHCAFNHTDLGDVNADKSLEAMRIFRQVCRLVASLGGNTITIHVGLGLDTTFDLCWNRTLTSLTHVKRYADSLGVRLCLENLAWGWSSRPELYEKMLRKSGLWATLDIGHAHVSPSIASQQYVIEDFTAPHAAQFLGAHIYHTEADNQHFPPTSVAELRERLHLLQQLPNCRWWVLELREQEPLLQTLAIVRQYMSETEIENDI